MTKKLEKGKKLSWLQFWQHDNFFRTRKQNFEIIDNYINKKPNAILDIGCGLALESEHFQKKYQSDLFLIDGDSSTTVTNTREIKYGPVENFKFYNKISDLKNDFDKRQLNYNFYDFNILDEYHDFGIKFDLIYSNLSCGFHYPASTYKKIITKNSDENTIIIMDFQKEFIEDQLKDIDIVATVSESDKAVKLHFRYV